MKLLLVIPPYNLLKHKDRSYAFPMGIAYVNAALREAGFDVEGMNMNHVDVEDRYAYLADYISTRKIDCVLSGGLCPEWRSIKKIFDIAKSVRSDIITVCGGGMITSEPIPCAELLQVDYAVVGQGEITDVELIQTLMDGGNISDVKGIVFKTKSGKYKQTLPREEIDDLDTIPFPNYDGLDMDKYLHEQKVADGAPFPHSYDRPRTMTMILGRSCPFHCKFCFHPSGTKYRQRSLDNFFMELDELMEKYAPKRVSILDELFSMKPDQVLEFCRRIKPYKITWIAQMRVDITLSMDVLKIMRESGCCCILYGLESYSQKVLTNMRKQITTEQIERTLKLTYDAGIEVGGSLIFGDELEDESTIYETLRFWFDHPEYSIYLAMIQSYPGSEYYKELVKAGRIKDKRAFMEQDDWRINLTQMPDEIYWKYVAVIELLSFYYHPKATLGTIEQIYLNEENEWVLETRCPHCGAKNVYRNVRPTMLRQVYFRLLCQECNRSADFWCKKERLPNFDKLEYLCRMIAEARDEHDFKEATDTLYRVYLETRDPNNPFPRITDARPRPEK